MKSSVFIASIFGIGCAAFAAENRPTLKIETYPIVADSICNPERGTEFSSYVNPLREKYHLIRHMLPPAERPSMEWFSGTPLEKGKEGEADLETRDAGLGFFIRVKKASEDLREWKATDPQGIVWTLRETFAANPSLPDYKAGYEIGRADSSLLRFNAVDSRYPLPGLLGARLYGNDCVISYWDASIANRDGFVRADSSTFHIVVNGIDLNAQNGYQNCYEYHRFAGRPFFIFERDDQAGWFFDGKETPGQFDGIFHDACCEPGMWNPLYSDNQCDFFALRDGMWYYVVGSFEK
jgi:hypothetical protein